MMTGAVAFCYLTGARMPPYSDLQRLQPAFMPSWTLPHACCVALLRKRPSFYKDLL